MDHIDNQGSIPGYSTDGVGLVKVVCGYLQEEKGKKKKIRPGVNIIPI